MVRLINLLSGSPAPRLFMQNDAAGAVLEDLIETLEDGHKGFEAAAEKLQANGHPSLAQAMNEYSALRRRFSDELRSTARSIGHEIEENGSNRGTAPGLDRREGRIDG